MFLLLSVLLHPFLLLFTIILGISIHHHSPSPICHHSHQLLILNPEPHPPQILHPPILMDDCDGCSDGSYYAEDDEVKDYAQHEEEQWCYY